MKKGSSLGLDVVLVEIIMALADSLVPKMKEAIPKFLEQGTRQGLVIGIDFIKAYNSVHDNYMTTFFLHLPLFNPHDCIIDDYFQGPIHVCNQEMVQNAEVKITTGIKQGGDVCPARVQRMPGTLPLY